MLHRVWRVPSDDRTFEETREVELVLNTLCKIKHQNIWYFDLRDQDACDDIMDTFIHMGLNPVHILLDADKELLN